jgi:hypothetical protein
VGGWVLGAECRVVPCGVARIAAARCHKSKLCVRPSRVRARVRPAVVTISLTSGAGLMHDTGESAGSFCRVRWGRVVRLLPGGRNGARA